MAFHRTGSVFRRVVVSIVVTALVGVVSASPASASHSTNAYENITEWNMAGSFIFGGSLTPAQALVSSVYSSGRRVPLTIIVNEICITQYNYLATNLSGFERKFKMSQDRSDTCDQFGNAVFWRGAQHVDGNYSETYPDSMQAPEDLSKPSGPERRNFVCGKAAYPVYNICTTHATNSAQQNAQNVQFRRLQVLRAVDLAVYFRSCCGPTFFGGDLNTAPTNSSLTAAYQSFSEAGAPTNSFTTGSAKLDYIFVGKNTHYIPHSAYLGATQSDHKLYVGYIAAW